MVELTPSDISSKLFYLEDGLKFTFSDRDYLKPVYDGLWDHIILCFGRQTEKSTYICNRILTHMVCIPYFTCIYVTPQKDQCVEFSRQKLDARLLYSPLIERIYSRGGRVDNVFEKQLSNGSRIVLRSSFTDPRAIRGISADLVAIDEVQDIKYDHIPVIHETLSHSDYKMKLYAGTPKTRDDTLDRLWNRSTQTEWMFKCPEKHWCRGNFDVIQRDGMRCPTCGRPVSKTSGEWVSQQPDRNIAGFRISQLLVPWVTWDDIIEKLDTYPHEQFANEVLAIPMDTADHPIRLDDLLVCCDQKQIMAQRRVQGMGYVFAGVDWGTGGNSYTVLTILSIYNDRFVLLYAKKYTGAESDPEIQVNDIARRCKSFGVQLIGADHGFGFVQNSQLRKAFGRDRILEFYSSHNMSKPIKWDRKANRYTMHRTTMMSRVFNGIRREQFKFPKWELFKPFGQDFLNVTAEYDDKKRVLKYSHPEDAPDDSVHSLMYAMLVAEIYSGQMVVEV